MVSNPKIQNSYIRHKQQIIPSEVVSASAFPYEIKVRTSVWMEIILI